MKMKRTTSKKAARSFSDIYVKAIHSSGCVLVFFWFWFWFVPPLRTHEKEGSALHEIFGISIALLIDISIRLSNVNERKKEKRTDVSSSSIVLNSAKPKAVLS